MERSVSAVLLSETESDVPPDLIVFGAEHETDGTDPELAELIATLTAEQQKAAARILKVFAEEINRK